MKEETNKVDLLVDQLNNEKGIGRWRCKCGHSACFLLDKNHPERKIVLDGYAQCSKCYSDIDVW